MNSSHSVLQAITSRVGEPRIGAYLGNEGGWGKGKCQRNRSEKRQFRALGFSREVKLTPSVARASKQH